MRLRSYYLAAASLLLFSCQRGQQETERNPGAAESTDDISISSLKQRFAPVMNGVWIKANYLDALARTRSPYRAAKAATEVVVLAVNLNRANGDSVTVPGILNNHEGYEMRVYLQRGQTDTSLPTSHFDVEKSTNFYELGYKLAGQDTTLLLNQYNEQRRLLSSVPYRRVWQQPKTTSSDPALALDYTARRLLFAGRYTATDSVGRTSDAELLPDGRVRGLGDFRAYSPNLDFVVTLGNDRDNLFLTNANRRRQLMTYSISGDTLRLYAAKAVDVPQPSLEQGRLQYTLVRRR